MRYSGWGVVALAVTLALFGFSDADIAVQALFHDPETNRWLVAKSEPVARLAFYTVPKILIVIFGIACLTALILSRWLSWAARRRRALIVVILSLIAVPAVVGELKSLTNVACPANLSIFGGTIPHVRLFDSYPADERPQSIQRCFPAGHASGGFALLAMLVLFRTERSRLLAATGALTLGSVMAGYKMAIGDHFLSHALVTLEIAVILIGLIHAATFRLVPRRIDRH